MLDAAGPISCLAGAAGPAVMTTRGDSGADIVLHATRHLASYTSPIVDPLGVGESVTGAVIAAHLAGAGVPHPAAIAVKGIGTNRLLCADISDVGYDAGLVACVNTSGNAHV